MNIAVISGDGIGPEVTAQAVRVLETLRPDVGYVEAMAGGVALRAGMPALPDETLALCKSSDAILFGSVGDPDLDAGPFDRRPETALFALRSFFGLYTNLRPVRTYPGLEHASSLLPHLVEGLDLVVVRELTGGIYFGTPKERRVRPDGIEEAVDTMYYNKPEIERIARVAFELARSRRKHLTSVDKQNILQTSRLWRDTVVEMATHYPDVRVESLLVDNAAMQLVRRPKDFDVLLAENMFGDILSDEAAILTGSIGTLPSASLGAGEPGRRFGMFEPIGGTAPDIAGRGVANPAAAILSLALLLRHSLDDEGGARRIETAVERAFASGARTADLARGAERALSTAQFTDEVLKLL